MRLRTRISDDLMTRLIATVPAAVETAWDHVAVVVMVEQLKFTSAGGYENDWLHQTNFTGVMRAELRANEVDQLHVEPLIANLVSNPVFLGFDENPVIGQISEKARAKLIEWRDTVRDQDLVSALRFEVSGTLAIYEGPSPRPQLIVDGAVLGDAA